MHILENVLIKARIKLTRNPSEKNLQFIILNSTVVQYNKTLIGLIFG